MEFFVRRALCADRALKGLSGQKKKKVHACARLDGEMAHTYAHLPANTAHACARLTLVCAHVSNHGSAWHRRRQSKILAVGHDIKEEWAGKMR